MEISQQTVTIETTDKTIESEKNATNPTITIQSDNNYLETPAQLIHSKSQENEQKPPNSAHQISSKGADALIVAALMGNSINKFNRGRQKRLATQQSAPMSLQSPVFINDSLTSSPRIVERKSIDKAKSFNEHDVTAIEMASLSATGPNKKADEGVVLTGSSNTNTAIIKNKNNTSNLTNQSITGSTKASKCMLINYFLFFISKFLVRYISFIVFDECLLYFSITD
jgi:hypothetical protein